MRSLRSALSLALLGSLLASTPALAQNSSPRTTRRITNAERQVLDNPSEVSRWLELGDAYRSARRTDDAARSYREALRLDKDNATAQERLSRLSHGRSLSELERQVLADPTNDEIWGDAGDEHIANGRTEQGLRFYVHALRIDPNDGEWQRKVNDYGGAELYMQVMGEIIDGRPHDDELIGDYADALRDGGDTEAACAQYRRALEIDPDDGEWLNRVAACDAGTSLYDDAMGGMGGMGLGGGGYVTGGSIPELEAALQQDPTNDEIMGDLGDAWAAQGDNARALEYYRRALETDPDDSEWIDKYSRFSGEDKLALLERLVRENPNNDELWGDLADHYIELQRTEDAISCYRRALELDPDDGEWIEKVARYTSGDNNHTL